MSFPGVTVPQAEAGKAAIAGQAIGGAGGILGPVGLGLSVAEGLGMFNGGGSSDIARAGGTMYTGQMSYSAKPVDTSTLIIVAVVVVGLLLIFKRKK